MVICLGRGVDLHMAQLMPLPLTISCSDKSRLALPFWYQLTRVVTDKGVSFIVLTSTCACCQDGEESVASWELRVEGRLMEEVTSTLVNVLHSCMFLTVNQFPQLSNSVAFQWYIDIWLINTDITGLKSCHTVHC